MEKSTRNHNVKTLADEYHRANLRIKGASPHFRGAHYRRLSMPAEASSAIGERRGETGDYGEGAVNDRPMNGPEC
jgi:hypothetical protein